jgi:hypothetical protein
MKNEKKSRREALKLLGTTGLFMGVVPVFFTSLKISQAEESGFKKDFAGPTSHLEEKTYISGSGSNLTVRVTGKPGRVFFVTFAGTNVRENFRRIPGSDGVINARGSGSVVINVKSIPITRVFLKVITGEPNNVTSGLGETEAISISIQNGIIGAFEGTVSRPILETKMEPTQTLIAMAATQESRILLR